jgi:translation initiation factor IF-1
VRAIIRETLPNSRYRCELEGGTEVVCHVAGAMRLKFVRILPGDEVFVEPSPLDPTKGRIVDRAGLRPERQES